MLTPLAHRLFCAWLALLVLTASVGFTVQRHVCRESGQASAAVVFTAPHHQCPPQMPVAGKARLGKACCEFSAKHHKVEAPVAAQKAVKLLPVAWLAPEPLPVTWAGAMPACRTATAARWSPAHAPPPRLAGKPWQSFVGCWVI